MRRRVTVTLSNLDSLSVNQALPHKSLEIPHSPFLASFRVDLSGCQYSRKQRFHKYAYTVDRSSDVLASRRRIDLCSLGFQSRPWYMFLPEGRIGWVKNIIRLHGANADEFLEIVGRAAFVVPFELQHITTHYRFADDMNDGSSGRG